MNAKEFAEMLASLNDPEWSILLRADHAKAKSSLVKLFALERNYFWIDARLGQKDVGDIIGMPLLIDGTGPYKKKFVHVLPELLKPAFVDDLNELGTIGDYNDSLSKEREQGEIGKPYEGIVLFFDELNRGTKDVQQAVFEPILDRKMNGQKLNPRCFVFAAINSNLDLYMVTETDPALLTRFSVVDLDPTVDEWIKWGESTGELDETILFMAKSQGMKQIVDPPPALPGKEAPDLSNPHPNRRSWHMFSKWYRKNKDKPMDLCKEVCTTFVGRAASETWAVSIENMKLQNVHASNVTASSAISEDIIRDYFRKETMNDADLKTKVDALNVSEVEELALSLITFFTQYKYLGTDLKDRVFSFSNIVSKEFFAKIWSGFPDRIKEKLNRRNPGHYTQFDRP
jgi:hypothetical protein